MFGFPLLTSCLLCPLIGALFILFFVKDPKTSKIIALISSLASCIISIYIWLNFNIDSSGFQFQEKYNLIWSLNCFYHLGIDGLSLCLIMLTTFLMPLCILISWKSINFRIKEYLVSFLMLETLLIGVFSALDLLVFYVFFEAMLIPMFLIIGIWGGENRIYAAIKFFLYTLAGSLLLLVAIIYIYTNTHQLLNLIELYNITPKFTLEVQKYLWLAFFASFAVKIPMWPFHTWLPDAHVEAPTSGSVILAGVLLKMGAYGFIRFSLPLFPDASMYYAKMVMVLSAIAIIYASLVAFAQSNMKKLIAYSSIAHMGFVTMGIFSFDQQALQGAIFQMISHGIVSAALFTCVGVLYDQMHTKEISNYGGVASKMPYFAMLFMLFTLSSIGLPGTSGFVGEMLVILGTFKVNYLFGSLAASSLVLGAAYMLWLYRRIFFGTITNDHVNSLKDLNFRETIIFAPLAILTIILGIYPSIITQYMHINVETLLKILK